jgi:Ser/Thr protein kinase RdoA (MazF antagonist)
MTAAMCVRLVTMDLAERVAAALDVHDVVELSGGHQSRVFRVALRNGSRAVAKVLDPSMVDRRELDLRLDVTAALADFDPRVCRPLVLGEHRVVQLSSASNPDYYLTCFEFASGSSPDPSLPDDARQMGMTLSQLHLSMSQLPPTPLPLVKALRSVPPGEMLAAQEQQLLHGDFAASNLHKAGDAFRIFDFDDCGYGPPAFDVANSLYMVLFDSSTHGTTDVYETFRHFFVEGYDSVPGPSLSEADLDRFIDLRVRALGSWLDDLDNAPIGIRSASPAWRATLHSFVSDYQPSSP